MCRALRVVAGVLLFFSSFAAWAYTPTRGASGVQVRWPGSGQIKLDIVGNPINSCDLDPEDFRASVVRGLQRWKAASGGRVGFDYWQGMDPRTYEANSSLNGHSSIYFASNGTEDSLTSNILGLTQVWYNTQSGEILETDTVLNDRDFTFTTDPKDTSGFGGGTTPGHLNKPHVFIENVITHEFGHSLGLAHSGGLQSTMLFLESPEQAHLSCDEQVGIHAVYPSGDSGERGSISGTVTTVAGVGIFGAQVQAISRRRGTALASALTDRSGHFTISQLEPGAYYLLAEPYYAGARSLPAFYSTMREGICDGGEFFSRSFLTDASGFALDPVYVSAGRGTGAPEIHVQCAAEGGAAVAAHDASSAPSVYDGNGTGFGVVDKRASFSGSGGASFYALNGFPGGRLELHTLGYSLYSPIKTRLSLLDASGNAMDVQAQDDVYSGDSGFVNHDSALVAEGLAAGNYSIVVESVPLNVSDYPAGPISLDPNPFFVLTGAIGNERPALEHELPVNARCRMTEDFSPYTSPAGDPPRRSYDDATPAVGSCGTISDDRGPGDPPLPPPGAGAIAGWFLPWIVMLVAGFVFRRLRARPGKVNVFTCAFSYWQSAFSASALSPRPIFALKKSTSP